SGRCATAVEDKLATRQRQPVNSAMAVRFMGTHLLRPGGDEGGHRERSRRCLLLRGGIYQS
ncbi:MAG: hypothetical protein MK095_08935, partial [Phycisphaerales bacterium]|nr:hypothetical protein [Phycisphaerales bacterium]